MYKCLECGHIFEPGEEAKWTEKHGFTDGRYEHFTGCPLCKSAYEETLRCQKPAGYVPGGNRQRSENGRYNHQRILGAFRTILTDGFLPLKFQRAKPFDAHTRGVNLRSFRQQAAEIAVCALLVLTEPAVDTNNLFLREVDLYICASRRVVQNTPKDLHRFFSRNSAKSVRPSSSIATYDLHIAMVSIE